MSEDKVIDKQHWSVTGVNINISIQVYLALLVSSIAHCELIMFSFKIDFN